MSKPGKRIKKYLRYSGGLEVIIGDIVLHDKDIWVVCGKSHKIYLRLKCLTAEKDQIVSVNEINLMIPYKGYPDHTEEDKTLDGWISRFSKTLGHYTDIIDDVSLVEAMISSDCDLNRNRNNISYLSDPYMKYSYLRRIYNAAATKIISTIPYETLVKEKVSSRVPTILN